MTTAIPSLLDGLSFEDEHVLVTGGASGIGRALAIEFAAGGATVTILDVDEAVDVVEEIRAAGGVASAVTADLTDEDAVSAAIDTGMDRNGPVSILVNNAGVNVLGATDAVAIEDWDYVQAVNVRGAFLTTRNCLPSLRETGGAVVNVASTAGLHGSPNYAAYGPSKAALINLTRQQAVDYAEDGIRFNVVAPGLIDIGMAAQELADPETRAFKRSMTRLDRFGQPQDVVNAVTFLASDAASFVTGAVVVVDGGWSA